MKRTVLLGCGVAAFILYLGMDLIATFRYDGYSYVNQTISELSAIDAPTRSMWIPLGFLYAALVLASGFGIWGAARGQRSLRIVGALSVALGAIGFVGWPFAAMHRREVLAAGGGTMSDTLHLVLGAVDTLIFFASIAIGARALGNRFRAFSIAAFAAIFAAGILTWLQSPQVAENGSTPWLGIWERIAILGSMLWLAVLNAVLLRAELAATPSLPGEHQVSGRVTRPGEAVR